MQRAPNISRSRKNIDVDGPLVRSPLLFGNTFARMNIRKQQRRISQ